MDAAVSHRRRGRRSNLAHVPAGFVSGARVRISRWRDRHALAAMSERELADIGVSRSQIAEEAGKPFWRA
jgi:uncharacterized protein YjiS (DUF1127 family)